MKKLTIRTRLTAWYTFTIMLFICGAFLLMYKVLEKTLTDQYIDNITRDAAIIADEVEDETGSIIFDLDEEEKEALTVGVIYTLFSLDNSFLDGRDEVWISVINTVFNETRRIIYNNEQWLVHDRLAYDDGVLLGWVRVLLPIDSIQESLSRLMFAGTIAAGPCLLLAILGGLLIAGRALKPVKDITASAELMGHGDLSIRIPAKNGNDEVGQLATAFNNMADNLEAAFTREKQFTSDASHEMRTPLAVIMTHAESAIKLNDINTYKESMSVILDKTKHMQTMFNQMLSLARGYEQKQSMTLEDIKLSEVINDIADEMQEQAKHKNINIQVITEEMILKADLMILTRIIMNLIDNSIKYGKDNGNITISATQNSSGQVLIAVEDDGIGISEADLPHLFERFYRADKSRTGEGTGAGLGLSFVKMAVKLHGGQVDIKSTPGKGSRIELSFPKL